MMIASTPYDLCPRCMAPIAVLESEPGSRMYFFVDEDSLTIRDMADMEDGKPVLFDEGRHKRHVCRKDMA